MKNIFLIVLLSFSIGKSFAQDTIIKTSSEKIIAKILEISPTEIKYKKFDFIDGPTYIELKSNVKMIVYSNGSKEIFEQKKPEKPAVVQPNDDVDYYSKTNSTNGTSGKIEPFKSKYKVEGKIINEKKMRTLLMDTKDPKIMSLVDQSKKAQRRQFIWIAAIPLAQIALLSLSSAPAHSTQVPSSTSPGSYTTQYHPQNNGLYALGAVTLVGAVACPIICINQKHKKKNTTAAAIKLYNQKF